MSFCACARMDATASAEQWRIWLYEAMTIGFGQKAFLSFLDGPSKGPGCDYPHGYDNMSLGEPC